MQVHLYGVKQMLLSNRELVSPILRALLFSNATLNVYFITILLFKPMALDQQLIVITGIGLQILFVCLAVQPMIRSTNLIHQLAPILYKAQQVLPPLMLRTKLKVMTYYEINHASGENKITYTLGPLGKITNSGLFEVFVMVLFGDNHHSIV